MNDSALLLFFVALVAMLVVGFILGKRLATSQMQSRFESFALSKQNEWQNMADIEKKKSLQKSRAVVGGLFSEQLAPYLPDFPFDPTEARFIGKPVDFMIFRGLAQESIHEVVFVEVKSGQSKLSSIERLLKQAILERRVSWFEYQVPEKITR